MFKPLKSLKVLLFITLTPLLSFAQSPTKTVFVSSNTSGQVGVFNLQDGNTSLTAFTAGGQDADGIAYTPDGSLYQVNRSSNAVESYGLVDIMLNSGIPPNVVHSSTDGFYGFNFSNGRGIAVEKDKIVVAQDATSMNGGNRFIVYDINTFGAIDFNKTLEVEINLWGIDLIDGNLYAVADNTNKIAIFKNFCDNIVNPDGIIVPITGTGSSLGSTGTGVSADATVAVTGLVRTHGIAYIAELDLMLLTDIGSAGNASDGAIFVIYNFKSVAADGVIRRSEYIRIGGSNTGLGNPVDIDYCPADQRIYIAERASGGGKLLAFNLPTKGSSGGNIPPAISAGFPGASSVAVGANRIDRWGGHLSENFNTQGQINAANSVLDWSIYPNPAVDNLQISWQQAKESTRLFLRVIDTEGQEVARQSVDASVGLNTFNLDIANLPTGVYRFIVESKDDQFTETFIKL
ncbi:MAG: T9SS type A sorting domain-containing protein [Saprospiraceae bacterium]